MPVVLGEVNGLRRLPIVIGGFEAHIIAGGTGTRAPAAPHPHDLMKISLAGFNVEPMK